MLIAAKKSLVVDTNNPQTLAGNIVTAPYAMGDVYWGDNQNVTITADATLAPDGTSLADLVVPTTTSSTSHRISKVGGGVGTTTAAEWVLRLRVKPAGYNILWMILADTASYTKQCQVQFDLSNKTKATVVVVTYQPRARIKRLAGGWFLCDMRVTVDANITHVIELRILNRITTNSGTAYSGDAVAGMYFWGAEFAPFAG